MIDQPAPLCITCGEHVNVLAATRCKTCMRRSRKGKLKVKYPLKIKSAVDKAIRRCYNWKDAHYENYGRRGLTVYTAWCDDRHLFMAYLVTLPGWDDPSLVIDRIDNDIGYHPGNLRWVTAKVSRQNQRRMT